MLLGYSIENKIEYNPSIIIYRYIIFMRRIENIKPLQFKHMVINLNGYIFKELYIILVWP